MLHWWCIYDFDPKNYFCLGDDKDSQIAYEPENKTCEQCTFLIFKKMVWNNLLSCVGRKGAFCDLYQSQTMHFLIYIKT